MTIPPQQGALGRRIAEARARKGLSLRDLAKLSGVPHSTIHDLETGATRVAAIDRVAALARSLGLPSSPLLSLAVQDARAWREPSTPVNTKGKFSPRVKRGGLSSAGQRASR